MQAIKRAIDVSVTLLALVLLSPVMLIIALLTYVRMGPPVLFRQERPGLNGVPFVMYKFRSMIDPINKDGRLLSPSERVTPFGRVLRDSSLDELPELFNVLRGEMSLVGPRPLLMEYLELYSPEQARRHEVKPGITGWAQANGRNAVTWEDKFAMDVWYVDNHSLWLDAKILWQTFATVIKREGIDTEGYVGMPKFAGSNGNRPPELPGGGDSRNGSPA